MSGKPSPGSRLVTVLQTADPTLFSLAGAVLQEAGLEFTVRGDGLRGAFGGGGIFNPLTGPLEILVLEEDEGRALELLQELVAQEGG